MGRCCANFDSFSQDTMMMGADFYETEAEMAAMLARGKVPLGVGENSKIRSACRH